MGTDYYMVHKSGKRKVYVGRNYFSDFEVKDYHEKFRAVCDRIWWDDPMFTFDERPVSEITLGDLGTMHEMRKMIFDYFELFDHLLLLAFMVKYTDDWSDWELYTEWELYEDFGVPDSAVEE